MVQSFSRGNHMCSVKCSLGSAQEIVLIGMLLCVARKLERVLLRCVSSCRKLNTNGDCACVCDGLVLEGGGSGMCTALLLTYTHTQHTEQNFSYVVQES